MKTIVPPMRLKLRVVGVRFTTLLARQSQHLFSRLTARSLPDAHQFQAFCSSDIFLRHWHKQNSNRMIPMRYHIYALSASPSFSRQKSKNARKTSTKTISKNEVTSVNSKRVRMGGAHPVLLTNQISELTLGHICWRDLGTWKLGNGLRKFYLFVNTGCQL